MFAGGGAAILQTPYRTPNANAHAERFVRTVRSECLDHLLMLNARQLERILRSYARHYSRHRPHQGISQEIPAPKVTPQVGVATFGPDDRGVSGNITMACGDTTDSVG